MVDAILETVPLFHRVPDPRHDFNPRQIEHSEAAPVLRRTIRRQGFLARTGELISENMLIARLGSEEDRTEKASMTVVPGAHAVSL